MSEAQDPFDDDYPTKRHSGSLQRGPIWEGLASMLAQRLREVEAACRANVDREPELRSRLAEARAMAAEAAELARQFKAWEREDPGYEARTTTLSRWQDLESRAHDFETSTLR
jgi:hypothetical protein